MTSYVTPKKNTAFKFYVGLIDQSNTKLLKANPTIASGDFKVSTDGGAFGNLATLPSANPASGRGIMIDLSNTEMNGDNIVVQCVDAAGAEWCDLMVSIQTSARQIDDLAFPATTGRSMVVDASGLVDANMVKAGPTGSGTAQTAKDIGGAVPAAAAGASGGLVISGSNSGTTTFGALTVTGATTMTGGLAIAAGATITGSATGAALTLTGGGTSGEGLKILTTSGDGILVTPTAGNAATLTANGTSKHGLVITGGTAGTSDGLKAVAGTGGVDIRGNQTGNLVGTVSTLTTYTGNTPQTGDSFARLGAPAGASVSADIAAVKVDTAAVKVQTDKLTFTVANQVDSNVLDWKSSAAPAMTGDAFARLGAPAGASVSADVAALKTDLDAGVTVASVAGAASNIKKNQALAAFEFLMTDSTNHNPATGLTVTATRSIDGAAFGACANAVTEVASGIYKISLAATDLNGNVITLRFVAAASDDQLVTIVTQP